MASLADGVASFARAAHDRTPPRDLHDRVMTTLEQEWRDVDEHAPAVARSPWLARAAAVVAIVAALTWGAAQTQRADVAEADAESYTSLLSTLGGKEFRIGELDSATTRALDGSVVLYDSHQGQSWGIVLVRAPGRTGRAAVTLAAADGRTIDAGTLEFQTDGDAATWLVTSSDLTPFDRLTIIAEDGTVLATADIAPA
jgi:hypothetical protein